MPTTQEPKAAIAAAADQFPPTFGLRAFPGDIFRIGLQSSYVNDAGEVQLYTQVLRGDKWLDFAKGTVRELRLEITQTDADRAEAQRKRDQRLGELIGVGTAPAAEEPATVAEALTAWDTAAHEVANRVTEWLERHGATAEGTEELREALKYRAASQETYYRLRRADRRRI